MDMRVQCNFNAQLRTVPTTGDVLNYAQAIRISHLLREVWKENPEIQVTVSHEKGRTSQYSHPTNIALDDGIITVTGISQEALDVTLAEPEMCAKINRAVSYSLPIVAHGGNGAIGL